MLRASYPLLLARSHLIDASPSPGAKILGVLHAVSPAPELGKLDHFVHGIVILVPVQFDADVVVPDLLL
jgi:hypothetical protein